MFKLNGTRRSRLEPLQKAANVSRWLQRFEADMACDDVDDKKKKHAQLASSEHNVYKPLILRSAPLVSAAGRDQPVVLRSFLFAIYLSLSLSLSLFMG